MAVNLPEDLPRGETPRCPHFGECGGCALQDVPYAAQVAAKEAALGALLGREVHVVPSPEPYGYRHRMDYIVAFGKVGLRKRGDYRTVVDLRECHIVPPRVSGLLAEVREWVSELGIRGYNFVTNRGDLRYLTTRYAPSSGELMVVLVTASGETKVLPLAERLLGRAESVVWAVQGRHGNDSRGEVRRTWGAPVIRQTIRGRRFTIGPNTFFQNNLLLADTLFTEVARHLRGDVLDLFCGVGVVGIAASDNLTRLLGVDNVPESIERARVNAASNGIEGAEYILEDANHFLAFREGPPPDTVVVDPPRSGLAPKLVRKLNRLGAPNLVYISCNPKTFAVDLAGLEAYQLEEISGFDMFPQTPHVELVSRLRRR